MFKINHAILHVFDFVSCVNVFSQEELDLSDKNVKSYVQRVAKHALGNIDNKRGEFEAESGFKNELSDYLNGQSNFTDLSLMIAEFLGSELGRAEQPASCDLLVVDFEDSPRAPKLTTEDIAELSEEEAAAAQAELDAAFAGRSARYFGLLLLESKPAFMHEVGKAEDGASVNRIERHHAILPSPSQKISSFALVDVRTMSVQFVDKAREIAGEERYLIPQGLLQCTMEASSKELIDTTMRLVEEVANEYGTNAAIATAKAKAYVAENAEDSDEVPFDEFVEEVFEDEGPRRSFVEAAQKENLPEHAPVERAVAKRVTRNHKIRTDTGIEITFPAEYAQNPEFIEFTSTSNGLIRIELKNRKHREQVAAREGVKRCLGNAVGSPRKPRDHHARGADLHSLNPAGGIHCAPKWHPLRSQPSIRCVRRLALAPPARFRRDSPSSRPLRFKDSSPREDEPRQIQPDGRMQTIES